MPAAHHSALSSLYKEHNSWLVGWLRARLGNSAEAADLAQDTFLRLLVTRSSEGIREPRTYLSSVARALMIDRFRRKAVEQAYLATLALRGEALDISPQTRLIILETLTAVDAMLDGLGERTRQIFLAIQLEGLTYIAAGERLGVSVTTVKKHMTRAIAHCLLLVDD